MASSYLVVKPVDKEASLFKCMLTIDKKGIVLNVPKDTYGILGYAGVFSSATNEFLGSYTPASSPVSNTIIIPLSRELTLGERIEVSLGGATPPVSTGPKEIWYVAEQTTEKNELVEAIKSLKPSVRILNVVGCAPHNFHHGLYRVPKRSCF